jgi:catechol 2,3-dioxygenase-like lactoylglutathione lyase family enzyme
MGATPLADQPERLQVADIVVELKETDSGWTGFTAEYPHYGFRYRPQDMVPMRDHIRAYDIPTGEIWTRHQVEGLMYFRDPSGNLLETACWHGLEGADRIPLSRQTGGDYETDLVKLNYSWDPPVEPDTVTVKSTQLDHLSLPVRDMPATARFWVNVMGAKLGRAPTHMVEIAGIDISFSQASSGWTPADADFPRYAFAVDATDLIPFKMHIEAFGIPTHDIRTRDGQDAFMYVRDPSGNLFELYCEDGFAGNVVQGGDTIDVAALRYDEWNDPGR